MTTPKTDKEIIKELAQMVADLSAMMMPLSGLTMVCMSMAAKKAGEHIGEEIKPSESAFEGTVKMVNNIRRPMEEAIDKLDKDNKALTATNKATAKELKELKLEVEMLRIYGSKESNGLADSVIHKINLYTSTKIFECIIAFGKKYNYYDPIYVERDGNAYYASTFKPDTIAPPEWVEGEYAYGETPEEALETLAKLKRFVTSEG